jgi:HAD superfamily hydrolase (TIGR01458 family)
MRTSPIKALLCDIGGVLYVGDTPIEGAIRAIESMKRLYPVRFVTNTTQKSGAQVVAKLQQMGFDIKPSEVITALDITRMFLEREGGGACFLMTDDAATCFEDLPKEPCNYVVVGDAQEHFSYANLNHAFRILMGGGELVAAAKNRYFRDSDNQLSMDAGGFVAALEYASGKQAHVIGKPSREFYRLACASMGVYPEETVMIGDDIESDILGAQEAGLKAAIVKTGKFSPEDLRRGIIPDAVLDSIADFSLLV